MFVSLGNTQVQKVVSHNPTGNQWGVDALKCPLERVGDCYANPLGRESSSGFAVCTKTTHQVPCGGPILGFRNMVAPTPKNACSGNTCPFGTPLPGDVPKLTRK